MNILTTLDSHSIKYLYAFLPMSDDGKKGIIDGQLHTNIVRGYIPSRITKHTFGYHLFRDLSHDECRTLRNRILESHFMSNDDDVLIFAIDTNDIAILDVDHSEYASHPFTQSLMQRSMYYRSVTKKFPKIFLRIQDRSFTSDNQLLAKVDGNIALELHTGRWSYCHLEAEVFGESILSITYDELLDGYGVVRRSVSDISSEHTCTDNEEWEEKEERFEKKLLKLLEVDKNWGVDYNNWINMGILLKYEFADADDIGRGLFHFYSSRLPIVYDEYGRVKNGYDEHECDAKWDSLCLRDNTSSHINETYLNKLIDHHPSLLPRHTTPISMDTPLPVQVEKILANIPNLVETISTGELRRFIKGIDENGYGLYKSVLMHMYHVDNTDEGWGNEEKEWRRTRPTKKHNLDTLKAILRSTNRACYDSFFCSDEEKEDYDLVKAEFEKYNFKLNSPPSYVYLHPDGTFEQLRSVDFITKYAQKKCNVWNDQTNKIERKPFIHLWMQDEHLQTFDRMIFQPVPLTDCDSSLNSKIVTRVSDERTEICINTFGRLEFVNHLHAEDDRELLDDILGFFKRQLCDNHEGFYEYMLKWMAFVLQNVGKKTRVVPIFKSKQGIGKGFFWSWFGKCILGTKYYHCETDMQNVLGHFNSLAENRLLILCDEIGFRDTKDDQNKLKNLISEEDTSITRKGVDSKKCDSFVNYVCATNNDLPFTITADDRRFTGIESKASRLSTEDARKYYRLFHVREKNSVLIATFARFLLKIDISNFDTVNDRVMTPFIQDCIQTLCPEIIQFLYFYTTEGEGRKYNENIKRLILYEAYTTWNAKYCSTVPKMSLTAFGRRIKKIEGVSQGYRTYTLDLNVLYKHVFPIYSLEPPISFE